MNIGNTKMKEETVIVLAWLFAIALCYIVYLKYSLQHK